MAVELRAGVFTTIFAKAAMQAQTRTGEGLAATAEAIARQARINASTGSHAYGTRTPAHPGGGPATISRTLVNSIAFSPPMPQGVDWVCRVGARSGMYPPYSARWKSKTPSSRYGYYLETGVRHGVTYPWLRPATHIAVVTAPVLFQRVFALSWV